jgi:hypothetical protein
MTAEERERNFHVYRLAEAAWERKLKAQPWRDSAEQKDAFITGFVNGYLFKQETP